MASPRIILAVAALFVFVTVVSALPAKKPKQDGAGGSAYSDSDNNADGSQSAYAGGSAGQGAVNVGSGSFTGQIAAGDSGALVAGSAIVEGCGDCGEAAVSGIAESYADGFAENLGQGEAGANASGINVSGNTGTSGGGDAQSNQDSSAGASFSG